MKRKHTNLILGAVFGASIAAVVALLFAPESGEELRKDAKRKAVNAKNTAEDYLSIAKDKGSDLAQTAGEAGSEMAELGKNTLDQLQDDFSNQDSFKEGLEEAKETYKLAKEIDKDIAQDKVEDAKDIAQDAKGEIETQ